MEVVREEMTQERERVGSFYLGNTTGFYSSRITPEGVPAAREGEPFIPRNPKALKVIRVAVLIRADVLDRGVNVYVGNQPLFSVRCSPEVKRSFSGHTIELSGMDRRSVLYEPLEGEVKESVGILSFIYATDGKDLYTIKVERGSLPSFGGYTASLAGAEKQAWDAYVAYRKVFYEPERFEDLMKALGPFPEIASAAQECGGNAELLKERVGPLIREKLQHAYRNYLLENITPNDLFARSGDRNILRGGGLLTGNFASLTGNFASSSENPLALVVGPTLVPDKDGVRAGAIVLSLITMDGEGNIYSYVNPYQGLVLSMAHGKPVDNKSKVYGFMTDISRYIKALKELKQEDYKFAGGRSSLRALSGIIGVEATEDVRKLAEIYSRAILSLGGVVRWTDIPLTQEHLDEVLFRITSPSVNGERGKIEEEAIRELLEEQRAENENNVRRGDARRPGDKGR